MRDIFRPFVISERRSYNERPLGDEKAQEVPFGNLVWRGVNLVSRYGKRHEYEVMRLVVEAIGPLASRLEGMYCDSKAGACYMVYSHHNKPINQKFVNHIAAQFYRIGGGHNGVCLQRRNDMLEEVFSADPDWQGDWDI